MLSRPFADGFGDGSRRLHAAAAAYVRSAFHQMGWRFEPRERLSTEQVAGALKVASRHRGTVERLLAILEEEEVVRREGEHWVVTDTLAMGGPMESVDELLARYPAAAAELTLLSRCGVRLADVLRGECDPLQLLFPDNDLETAANLYRDSAEGKVMNSLVQSAVSNVVEHLPPGRRLRVLELGAGTGGTTSYVLPVLPAERTDYVFTDLSPLFTSKARERFRDYDFVRYELLDLEREPGTQALGLHQFHLVIAANVLHATADLRASLRHARQLLAPGGLLILLEGTAPTRFTDLTFGLTEGWWRFTDHDLRQTHPFLDEEQWKGLLGQSGFVDPVGITTDSEDAVKLSQAVLVARAADTRPEEGERAQGSWLIFADVGGVGADLARVLEAQAQRCVIVYPGEAYAARSPSVWEIDPSRPVDFHRLMDESLAGDAPTLRGVLHLWGLDTAAQALDYRALEQAQVRGCGSVLHLAQALLEREAPH
jgi:microcystin synthetase protein McyG